MVISQLHKEELRLRMDAAIGRAPALALEEMTDELRLEARAIEKRAQAGNKNALLNVVSDSSTAAVSFRFEMQPFLFIYLLHICGHAINVWPIS